ncbi:MAG: hypothetical protein AMXMBFR60_26180 [Chloroflexota bacterium]
MGIAFVVFSHVFLQMPVIILCYNGANTTPSAQAKTAETLSGFVEKRGGEIRPLKSIKKAQSTNEFRRK